MDAIQRFIEELCSRPAIGAMQIEAIEHGLYTAWRAGDPTLWDRLLPVFSDRHRSVVDRLETIKRVTDAYLGKAA